MEKGDDPYKILALSKTCSDEEIKKAYRQLALKHHPDRCQDLVEKEKATQIFAQIAAAYELLSDQQQRKNYDELQADQKSQGGKAKGFSPGHFKDFDFHSPYEVFKRDFEAQYGFPYPGAKYDFNQGKDVKRININSDGTYSSEANNNNNEPKRSSNKAASSDNKGSSNKSSDTNTSTAEEKPKKKNFFCDLFGRKKGNNETALVPHTGGNTSDPPPSSSTKKSSTALAKQDKATAITAAAPAPSSSTETALVKSYGIEGDNRPISMETTTKQIKHKDGTIETLTEIKMVRPDGSIERVRTSDRADKHEDWAKRKDKPPPAEQEKPKMLTNGGSSKKSSSGGGGGEKPKMLTNGPKKSSEKSKKSSSKLLTNGEEEGAKKSKKSSKTSTALTVKE